MVSKSGHKKKHIESDVIDVCWDCWDCWWGGARGWWEFDVVWCLVVCLGTFDLCCFQGGVIRKGARIYSWCHLLWQQHIYKLKIYQFSVAGIFYTFLGKLRAIDFKSAHDTPSHLLLLCPNAFGRFGLGNSWETYWKQDVYISPLFRDNDKDMPFCESLISRAHRRLALQKWDTRILYLTNTCCFAGDKLIFSNVEALTGQMLTFLCWNANHKAPFTHKHVYCYDTYIWYVNVQICPYI